MSSRAAEPIDRLGDRPSYWKPVLEQHWAVPATDEAEEQVSEHIEAGSAPVNGDQRRDLCHGCGAEFVVDSPYCRMCGRQRRDSARAKTEASVLDKLDFHRLQRALGLGPASLVCFIVGIVFFICAGCVGLMYSASTFSEWQAIQFWRLEWLAAAAVVFICGILLKRR